MTTTRRTASILWLALVLALVPGVARAAEYQVEREPQAPAADELTQAPEDTLEPAPPEPAPVDPAPVEPAPAEPPPAEPTPADPEPAQPEPAQPEAEPAPAPPAAPPEAVNRSRTVQVIVQVQVGCRHHCDGTAQSQTAVQEARTEQTAVAPEGVAKNESTIEQHVWQLQLGCVFFCTGTSQTQTVVQRVATEQTAAGADASNTSSVTQTANQVQAGRRRRSMFRELRAFLRALSLDVSVTLQVIRQVQVADCRHHCTGGSQVQLAVQQALVLQEADARGYD